MDYYDQSDYRTGRYFSPSPPRRPAASRRKTFDKVKDAVASVLPGSNIKNDRHHHESYHRYKHEEYLPSDYDEDYYEEEHPSHRRRQHESGQDQYYYNSYNERPRHRGSSGFIEHEDPYSDTRSHRSHRAQTGGLNFRQAAEAAIGAMLIEGWRSRHDQGRMSRIATAAVGAAGTTMLVGKEHDRKNKRHIAEGTLGGLILDRVVNGQRKR